MSDTNFSSVVESLFKGMNSVLGTKTVVGEATKIDDTIILPLVDVSFGVGAGASDKTANKTNSGMGGFGAKLSPSAVLIIKNGQTKLVNIKNQDAVTKILDLVPDVVDKFTNKKSEAMSDDEAIDIAFPEDDDVADTDQAE